MKLIPLMCIVLVIMLTSFPATIKGDDCHKTIQSCLRLEPKEPKDNKWKTICCPIWKGPIPQEFLACLCRIRKNPFDNNLLNRVLRACELGNKDIKC
ncbi:hypothetical protein Bca4012_068382 [Brassica carinata]